MLLRDVERAGEPAGTWLSAASELDDLRDAHCRSIVIVTDTTASGRQLTTLADSIARNRTIQSWRSFGWIKIYAVAFAASNAALDTLRKSDSLDGAWAVELPRDFSNALWDPVSKQAIVELCETKCLINEKWALGFGGSAGLFVSERGAPNNLPAVLWQDVRGWIPLFPRRTVPVSFAAELNDYKLTESLPALAERVGQLRLGRNKRVPHFRASSQMLLQALVVLRQQQRTVEQLAAALAIDVSRAETLFRALQTFSWIDGAGAITESGQSELKANKRGLRRTTAELEGNDALYFPQSLR
jgi:hypothetical protein